MKIIVIGKDSNLSTSLKKEIPDIILISARNISEYSFSTLKDKHKSICVIFNNFYSSALLNESSNFEAYINQSISITSNVLSYLTKYNLNVEKIIYSSSSSVYGNNNLCSEVDEPKPQSLQACLKLSNEKLIERFCNKNLISYTITRIFNMYGGRDRFSIISKIEKCLQNKKTLNLINNGSGVRDYIYIGDVIKIYKELLTNHKNSPKIINIGTGIGISVAEILSYLKNESINLKTLSINKDEIKESISCTNKLKKFSNIKGFVDVTQYLIKKNK